MVIHVPGPARLVVRLSLPKLSGCQQPDALTLCVVERQGVGMMAPRASRRTPLAGGGAAPLRSRVLTAASPFPILIPIPFRIVEPRAHHPGTPRSLHFGSADSALDHVVQTARTGRYETSASSAISSSNRAKSATLNVARCLSHERFVRREGAAFDRLTREDNEELAADLSVDAGGRAVRLEPGEISGRNAVARVCRDGGGDKDVRVDEDRLSGHRRRRGLRGGGRPRSTAFRRSTQAA